MNVCVSREDLARVLPAFLLVSPTGHIEAAGPTVARLRGHGALAGARLLEAFEFRRPAAPASLADLIARGQGRLALAFRDAPRTAFKGVLVALEGGGALIDLGFGIGAAEAVAEYGLTASDFSPTDPTVEMLYLAEANRAAMEEARRLNKRLEGARNAAEAEALTDALTGLGNRRAMEEALARLVAEGAPFGLINFDLDRFKAVNDTLGHAAGDAVLSAVAGALRAELRRGDLAARVGGDEFVAILPALDEPAQLAAIAGRIIARVEIPVPYGDTLCSVSASAGIAVSTHYTAPDPERLLQDADRALYASKHAGRGRATLFGAALAKPTPKRKREAVRG